MGVVGFLLLVGCVYYSKWDQHCLHAFAKQQHQLTHWCPAVTAVISLQSKKKKKKNRSAEGESIHFWMCYFISCLCHFGGRGCMFLLCLRCGPPASESRKAPRTKTETEAVFDLPEEFFFSTALHCTALLCTQIMAFHFKVNVSDRDPFF